jgi:hypothetical protein
MRDMSGLRIVAGLMALALAYSCSPAPDHRFGENEEGGVANSGQSGSNGNEGGEGGTGDTRSTGGGGATDVSGFGGEPVVGGARGAADDTSKPMIMSFTANYKRVCRGSAVTLTAVFANGAATIDNDVGAVTTGTAKATNVSGKTTYTLTVASAGVASATATVTVDVIANGTFAYTLTDYVGAAVEPQTAVLNDGRVIVFSGTQDKAQIFNPADETFASVPLPEALAYPVVSVLPDGRVLLAGGFSVNGGSRDAAYLIDPETGDLTPTTGKLKVPMHASIAAPLANGKFLIPGGVSVVPPNVKGLQSGMLYEPKTGQLGGFVTTPNMSIVRWGGAVELLDDGKVLLAGGCVVDPDAVTSQCPTSTKTAELYDAATGQAGGYTAAGNAMSDARYAPASAKLKSGQVLVVGGLSGNAVFKSADLFDPVGAGSFSATGAMANARMLTTATLLSDGRVLVTGGQSGQPDGRIAASEVYDPGTGKFTATGAMNTDRAGHSARLLKNGMVLIVGGQADLDPGGSKAAAKAELYCP